MKKNYILFGIIVLIIGGIIGSGSFYLYTKDKVIDECPECPKCNECSVNNNGENNITDKCPECPKCDEGMVENNNESGKYYILKNGKYVESKAGKENIERYAHYYESNSFTLFAYDEKLSLKNKSGMYSDYEFNSRIVQFHDNSNGGVYILLENGTLYNFDIPYDLSKGLTKKDFETNLSKVNVKPIFQIIEMEVPTVLTCVDSYIIYVGYGYDGNYYELDSRDSDYAICNDYMGDDNVD